MSTRPTEIPQSYREAASRAVLLTRLALHTYAHGPKQATENLSSSPLTDILQEEGARPLKWTEETMERCKGAMTEMMTCSDPTCIRAATQGPKALKETVQGSLAMMPLPGASIGDIVIRLQDCLTYSRLTDTPSQTEILSQVFVDPSELNPQDIAEARSVTDPIMPRCGPRWLDQENVESALQAGREETFQEMDSDFKGMTHLVTSARRREQEGNRHWERVLDDEGSHPDWTLDSFDTGKWSDAAWAQETSQHYTFG